jgi:hypothetical protein
MTAPIAATIKICGDALTVIPSIHYFRRIDVINSFGAKRPVSGISWPRVKDILRAEGE